MSAQAIDAPKILVGILDLGIDATKILGGILAPALDAIEILVGILATRAPPAWSARPDLGRSGHPPTKCPEVRVAEHATKTELSPGLPILQWRHCTSSLTVLQRSEARQAPEQESQPFQPKGSASWESVH